MTPRERAEALHAQWQNRTLWKEEMILDIEKAVVAAIEEDRKSRECCKQEREAIIKTAEERRKVVIDYMQDLDQDSMNYKIATIQISELDHMISMTRARSES